MADERKWAIGRRQKHNPILGSRDATSKSKGFARQTSGA
jgi:hypothetical protein